jgi:hypothetical protein
MAIVHITIGKSSGRNEKGEALPVEEAVPVASQTMDSTASSVASTISAPPGTEAGFFNWTIVARGGDVWVNFGTNPTAGEGVGHLITAGVPRSFTATAAGQKVAVRDVN